MLCSAKSLHLTKFQSEWGQNFRGDLNSLQNICCHRCCEEKTVSEEQPWLDRIPSDSEMHSLLPLQKLEDSPLCFLSALASAHKLALLFSVQQSWAPIIPIPPIAIPLRSPYSPYPVQLPSDTLLTSLHILFTPITSSHDPNLNRALSLPNSHSPYSTRGHIPHKPCFPTRPNATVSTKHGPSSTWCHTSCKTWLYNLMIRTWYTVAVSYNIAICQDVTWCLFVECYQCFWH